MDAIPDDAEMMGTAAVHLNTEGLRWLYGVLLLNTRQNVCPHGWLSLLLIPNMEDANVQLPVSLFKASAKIIGTLQTG